jgi:uncharacterized membrane protein YhaH (DUF805 family)
MGWDWYMQVLKKYAVFSGRARRKEYWFFILWYVIISIGLAIIDSVAGLHIGKAGVLQTLYALALLIPSLAVAVRRLHDIGRTGWWLLIGLIPLIGVIVLLVFMFTDSQPGENEYGPSPKAAAA